jgi:hypothetical protein
VSVEVDLEVETGPKIGPSAVSSAVDTTATAAFPARLGIDETLESANCSARTG